MCSKSQTPNKNTISVAPQQANSCTNLTIKFRLYQRCQPIGLTIEVANISDTYVHILSNLHISIALLNYLIV